MDFLEEVLTIAKQAGDVLSAHFHSAFLPSVTMKSDKSPVTQADIAANKIITEGLQKITPDIPVLSEENTIPDFDARQSWKQYWLVDPLDGTRGFINKSREFCVCIALIENQLPIFGVIYSPFDVHISYAIKDKGAWKRSCTDQTETQLQVKKGDVKQLRVLCGHSHRNLEIRKFLSQSFSNVTLTALNSALKFTVIASGLADLYLRFGPTSEWDTAAGHCIVAEAGGAVVDFQGKPLQYNVKSSVINPPFLAMADVSRLEQYLSIVTSRKFI
ncbi:MAG: 3'(2'),5'-bisphosphate nucleotidase CysQ [Coxiellaceae bacterium]|nr:3'(2'),5'-bisphosphate nucleotidase CysQ [Coxiellaceae bacterium]